MSQTPLSLLDQIELLQLASRASAGGAAGHAIGYLKEAVSRSDASGAAHYLLGAQYAQVGLYDRAIAEMEAAIALDPALSTARLQLGLLWLSSGNRDMASQVLSGLADLVADDPLRLFGAGLCHLIKGEFAEATRCLTEGIARNTRNEALNIDMQKIADQAARAGAAVPPAALADADGAPPQNEEDGGLHMLLSAYTGNISH